MNYYIITGFILYGLVGLLIRGYLSARMKVDGCFWGMDYDNSTFWSVIAPIFWGVVFPLVLSYKALKMVISPILSFSENFFIKSIKNKQEVRHNKKKSDPTTF